MVRTGRGAAAGASAGRRRATGAAAGMTGGGRRERRTKGGRDGDSTGDGGVVTGARLQAVI